MKRKKMDPALHEWYFDGAYLVCRRCTAYTGDHDIDPRVRVVMTDGVPLPALEDEHGITCAEAVIQLTMKD